MRHPLTPLLLVVAAAATACSSSNHAASPAPTLTVIETVIVTQTPTALPATTPPTTTVPATTPPTTVRTTAPVAKAPAPTPPPAPTAAPAPVPASVSPATVVEEYYAAINGHDFGTAWNLGGYNFVSDYATFADDFAGTAYDTLTVTGTQGDTVSIHLDAAQADGSVKVYEGTYTARHGLLVGASIRQIGALPPPNRPTPPSGVILAPNGDYYREGEYCPNADAGLTTRDASGTTLTCILESGRYHWH